MIVRVSTYANGRQAQEGSDSASTSHAATPTASFSGQAGKNASKKKRPTDKDDEDVGKPKRSKISYSRD